MISGHDAPFEFDLRLQGRTRAYFLTWSPSKYWCVSGFCRDSLNRRLDERIRTSTLSPQANADALLRGWSHATKPGRLYVDQEIKEARNAFRARIHRALPAVPARAGRIRSPNYPPRNRTHGIEFHQSCLTVPNQGCPAISLNTERIFSCKTSI